MQLTKRLLCFHLFLIGVTSNTLPAALPSMSGSSTSEKINVDCRCAPDQWEGVLSTSEHEVDIFEGRHHELRGKIVVHYDYVFKRLATDDLGRGQRSVADYAQGVTYIVDKRGSCRAMKTVEPMRRMCFPGDVTRVTTTTVGAMLPVVIWKFTEPNNVTIRTIATADTCIPVSEEIVDSGSDYVSLTSTLYSDVTLGIQDPDVFQTPNDCKMESNPSEYRAPVLITRQTRRYDRSNGRSSRLGSPQPTKS